MLSKEVRKLFLSFFEKKGHKILPSSSLIPFDDNSVLLTTAGMQQFKKYFTYEKNPKKDLLSQRVTTIQKCFRTTDIEEIGDESHLTFFEMLGNFSFGPIGEDNPKNYSNDGYFKRSAIFWANEFLTKELGLKIDYVTIFQGDKDIPLDQESMEIWKEIGFSNERIKKRGKEDNFWGPTGEEGPCGPTTEIYIQDLEIWNLVFNEYYQDKNKKLRKIEFPGVDTGMGFERLLKVLQSKGNIFEIDLFQKISDLLDKGITNFDLRRKRIVLDHLRGSVFLVADGLYPSNLARGYVLRRILRRLTLNLKFLGFKIKNLDLLVKAIIDEYVEFYPELKNFDKIKQIIFDEVSNFEKTLNIGIKKFNKLIKGNESGEILGEKVFILHTSYGLPIEITKELLLSQNMAFNQIAEDVYQKLFKKHQEISKKIDNKN